jgi:hypothetical protein
VLGAAGLLLTAGGILTVFGSPGAVALLLMRGAGVATAVGVGALLVVLYPRGGSPREWLLADEVPIGAELAEVARLASRKNRWLRVAIWALGIAVGLAALAVIVP